MKKVVSCSQEIELSGGESFPQKGKYRDEENNIYRVSSALMAEKYRTPTSKYRTNIGQFFVALGHEHFLNSILIYFYQACPTCPTNFERPGNSWSLKTLFWISILKYFLCSLLISPYSCTYPPHCFFFFFFKTGTCSLK